MFRRSIMSSSLLTDYLDQRLIECVYDHMMGFISIDDDGNIVEDFDNLTKSVISQLEQRQSSKSKKRFHSIDFVSVLDKHYKIKLYVDQTKQFEHIPYIQNPNTLRYEPLSFHITSIIQAVIKTSYHHSDKKKRAPVALYSSLKQTSSDVYDQISNDLSLEKLNVLDESKYMAFKNGVFKREELSKSWITKNNRDPQPITDHDYDVVHYLNYDFYTSKVYNNKHNLVFKQIYNRIISNWFGDENSKVALQIYRSVLEKDNRKRAAFLEGDGGDGKSTFIELILNIIGRHRAVQIDINDFDKPSSLGKIDSLFTNLIYSTETMSIISERSWNVFKKVVMGESNDTFVKFKDNIDVSTTAMQIFASNSQTRIPQTNEAAYRRVIMLKFIEASKQNRDDSIRLDDYINNYEFLEFIVNYVFRNTDNFKEYDITQSLLERNDQVVNESDSTYLFLQDNLFLFDGIKIVTSFHLYQLYVKWCKDTHRKDYVKNQTNFTRDIIRHMKANGYYVSDTSIRIGKTKLQNCSYMIQYMSEISNSQIECNSRYFEKSNDYLIKDDVDDLRCRLDEGNITVENVDELTHREYICLKMLSNTGHTLAQQLV